MNDHTTEAPTDGASPGLALTTSSEMRRALIDRAWAARHDITGHEGPNVSLNYEDGWDDAMAHINARIGVATLEIIAELCEAKTPHCPERIAAAMRGIFSLPNNSGQTGRNPTTE